MLLTDVPAGLLDSHVLHIANVKKIATVKIKKTIRIEEYYESDCE